MVSDLGHAQTKPTLDCTEEPNGLVTCRPIAFSKPAARNDVAPTPERQARNPLLIAVGGVIAGTTVPFVIASSVLLASGLAAPPCTGICFPDARSGIPVGALGLSVFGTFFIAGVTLAIWGALPEPTRHVVRATSTGFAF
jgi:hypothetical protein